MKVRHALRLFINLQVVYFLGGDFLLLLLIADEEWCFNRQMVKTITVRAQLGVTSVYCKLLVDKCFCLASRVLSSFVISLSTAGGILTDCLWGVMSPVG